jgi:hypothetical protein
VISDTACEHGWQRRKCPHCECNALQRRLEQANGALDALEELANSWPGSEISDSILAILAAAPTGKEETE